MESAMEINGVKYVREDSKPTSGRAVVVVDRGWIFAGDIRRENGRIYISKAVWVFRWESCGFSKVIENPSNADIRPIANIDLPEASEIFCVPVGSEWGLENA
jgi:hypothetical protein